MCKHSTNGKLMGESSGIGKPTRHHHLASLQTSDFPTHGLRAKEAYREEVLITEPLWPVSLDFLGYPQSKNACEISPTGICYENTQPLGREILEITF